MKTNTEKTTEEKPEVKSDFFDGFWDVKEPVGPNQYETVRRKLWLNTDEQKKWIGDIDPNIYFRDGVVPAYAPKSFGALLPEDRLEVQTLRKQIPLHTDILMFKHDLQNIYTLLIPKYISEHELNKSGDFENRLVRYDTRSVVFTGGVGRPSSFEADYFAKHTALFNNHFKKVKAERGL